MISIECVYPDWSAPDNIRAFTTTRISGYSQGHYAGLNLASHVKDNQLDVEKNRQLLIEQLALPAQPLWLDQVHGVTVVNAAGKSESLVADASYCDQKNRVCAVLTADCLPVLICNRQGTKVAAAHAGWRGLLAGVIEETIHAMQEPAENILVWLGPAIGPHAFEVGQEVKDAFINDMLDTELAFRANRPGHYLVDIYQIAKIRLNKIGVVSVSGGDYCTYTDSERFYSYRREVNTGRMASLIWMED
ncbi:MAG: peptidoglycan editing factor PgeF [Gammaproteobacteria bacterium]|nr:peptidoglycan editing factor PgeF [Gammaproteobacteria bacterium]MCW8909825.1 peptidoglycan editing factor PgeF [Gammaproteobacteria bacterium]MCW9056019.1 peptidoglycan editing factor PgeF [Gammaproteobacteria bacterium]